MPKRGPMPFTCLPYTRHLLRPHPSPTQHGLRHIQHKRTHSQAPPKPRLRIRKHETASPIPQPEDIRKYKNKAPIGQPQDSRERKGEPQFSQLDAPPNPRLRIHKYDTKPPLQSTAAFLDHVRAIFPRPNEPHLHADTIPPTQQQLASAQRFFTEGEPRYAFSCAYFRQFPESSVPEVAFLGRSNTGKSSLLNALYGRSHKNFHDDMAHISSVPGKTRTMNVYLVGKSAEGGVKPAALDMQGQKAKDAEGERWIAPNPRTIAIVDMPGHGFGSRASWGPEIVKYLKQRRQLRRAFLLVDAEHGIKSTDEQVLDILRQAGVPHQIIVSKVDKIVRGKGRMSKKANVQQGLEKLKERLDDISKQLIKAESDTGGHPALREILASSSESSLHVERRRLVDDRTSEQVMGGDPSHSKFSGSKIGINGVRWATMQAAGLH